MVDRCGRREFDARAKGSPKMHTHQDFNQQKNKANKNNPAKHCFGDLIRDETRRSVVIWTSKGGDIRMCYELITDGGTCFCDVKFWTPLQRARFDNSVGNMWSAYHFIPVWFAVAVLKSPL